MNRFICIEKQVNSDYPTRVTTLYSNYDWLIAKEEHDKLLSSQLYILRIKPEAMWLLLHHSGL